MTLIMRYPSTAEEVVRFCEEKLRNDADSTSVHSVEVVGTTEMFLDMARRILELESRCVPE